MEKIVNVIETTQVVSVIEESITVSAVNASSIVSVVVPDTPIVSVVEAPVSLVSVVTQPTFVSHLAVQEVIVQTIVLGGGGSNGSGDMLKSVYDTDGDGKVDAAETADSVPWTGIIDPPATYTPSAHGHSVADINDFPATIPPSAHSHPKAEISDFPATMPPTAHQHQASDVSGLPLGLPTGGTTGQIPAKTSNIDGEVAWVDPPTGGGAVDSVNGQTGVVVLDAQDVGAEHLRVTSQIEPAQHQYCGWKYFCLDITERDALPAQVPAPNFDYSTGLNFEIDTYFDLARYDNLPFTTGQRALFRGKIYEALIDGYCINNIDLTTDPNFQYIADEIPADTVLVRDAGSDGQLQVYVRLPNGDWFLMSSVVPVAAEPLGHLFTNHYAVTQQSPDTMLFRPYLDQQPIVIRMDEDALNPVTTPKRIYNTTGGYPQGLVLFRRFGGLSNYEQGTAVRPSWVPINFYQPVLFMFRPYNVNYIGNGLFDAPSVPTLSSDFTSIEWREEHFDSNDWGLRYEYRGAMIPRGWYDNFKRIMGMVNDPFSPGAPVPENASDLHYHAITEQIGVVTDAGTSTITIGSKGYREVAFNGTIVGYTLMGNVSGDIVVDIRKASFADYPITASITAASKPTLAASQKAQDSVLDGWTTAVTAGDIFEFVVEGMPTINKIWLTLHITRS